MVNFQIVDGATINGTNSTFTYDFGLTNGPFGFQELESVLRFPASNGRSWIISTQTSDVAVVVLAFLVLTFSVDRYFFKSRYLVHIGGAKRETHSAAFIDGAKRDNYPLASFDKNALLYEKEARDVELGQKCSNDNDGDSETTVSAICLRWVRRVIYIMAILFLAAIFGNMGEKKDASKTQEKAPKRSSTKAESGEKADISPRTSRWGRFIQHSWVQGVSTSAIGFIFILVMLAFFVYQLLFWPLLLMFLVLLQCACYEALNQGALVPWRSIALESTIYLVIWTIMGVTLLLRPNRLQGVLWKCLKWTHAVNWWLFWGVLESYEARNFVAKRIGLPYYEKTIVLEMLIMRPSLVAYLYAGVVRDVVVAVRVCKYLWNSDITKI